MRQLLWLYVRAWLWMRWSERPRLPRLFWGFSGLGLLCMLSLFFRRELWSDPTATSKIALGGLLVAFSGAGWVLLGRLGQWWTTGWRGWQKLLLVPLLGPLLGAVALGAVLATLAVAYAAGI